MEQNVKEKIIQKVNDECDAQEMQRFADAYMTGGDKFWDKNYDYSAFVLGNIISQHVREVSKDTGFMNKVLASRTIRPGEIIRYDKDPHIVGYAIDEHQEVYSVGSGRYLYPPEVEVSFTLSFPDKVADGKKFVQDLMHEALKKLITIQDLMLFKLLNRITKMNATIISSNFENMFRNLIKEIEMKRIPAEFILLNNKTNKKFVTQAKEQDKPDQIYQSNGSPMIVTKSAFMDEDPIPEDIVFVIASTPYVGGAPIRIELFAEPMKQKDEGKEPFIGLFFYKLMSMVVINPFTVVRGQLDGYKLCADHKD